MAEIDMEFYTRITFNHTLAPALPKLIEIIPLTVPDTIAAGASDEEIA